MAVSEHRLVNIESLITEADDDRRPFLIRTCVPKLEFLKMLYVTATYLKKNYFYSIQIYINKALPACLRCRCSRREMKAHFSKFTHTPVAWRCKAQVNIAIAWTG